MSADTPSPLSRWLTLITSGGCLAMVFITCVQSPVTTEFLRGLGATEWQFGIIGGLPMLLLVMQYVGAFLANRVARRKPYFIYLTIGGRLVYLLVAAAPAIVGKPSPAVMVLIILLLALYYGTTNLTVPLWFSWMGDLIPARILNRYWGVRHQYMTICWTLTFLAIAFGTYMLGNVPPERLFQVIVSIGVTAGVIDILLFCWVGEPPNTPVTDRKPLEVLLQPLRDRQYRSFIRSQCAWSFAAMFAAAFMQLYVLKVLKVPLWQTNYIWCSAGLGAALAAGHWGRVADKHGTRPVIILSTSLKPMIVLVFLFITRSNAALVLPFAFFLDSMLNAGMSVSANGYMLKMAPTENRSMFIASMTSLTGLAGGLGAICGGTVLEHLDGMHWLIMGRLWNNYHVLFLVSLLMRLGCIPMAFTIREPESSQPVEVLNYFRGTWPMRMVTFPVGLYRRLVPGRPDEEDESSAEDAKG